MKTDMVFIPMIQPLRNGLNLKSINIPGGLHAKLMGMNLFFQEADSKNTIWGKMKEVSPNMSFFISIIRSICQ